MLGNTISLFLLIIWLSVRSRKSSQSGPVTMNEPAESPECDADSGVFSSTSSVSNNSPEREPEKIESDYFKTESKKIV